MLDLRNGDCLEILKDIPSKTIDLVFADLPYGQTNCKWDCKIDLELLWKELLRVAKSDHTPFFFTVTTKFGYELIKSNEKMFKYDLVWAKSNPCGFLQAKKQPMRKHELLYVFYKKQPAYDISSHKHKFKKEEPPTSVIKEEQYNMKTLYGDVKLPDCYTTKNNKVPSYDPPLPTSVIKEEMCVLQEDSTYGKNYTKSKNKEDHQQKYDPPLPTSVLKEECIPTRQVKEGSTYGNIKLQENREAVYDPPLPTSIIKEEVVNEKDADCYNFTNRVNNGKLNKPYTSQERKESVYDPPLPTSVIKEDEKIKSKETSTYGKTVELGIPHTTTYDPPLPTSLLEIKSVRLKQHSTAKPPDLMKWILKYYSKEGDVILDPTMGSNPMGLACKEMNRKFIGIEMDETIYNFACDRVK